MYKRAVALMATMLLCLAGLSACGGSSNDEGGGSGAGSSTSSAAAKPKTGVKIGFAVPVLANPYWKSNADFAKKMGAQLGAEVIIADAQEKEDNQLKNVQDLIAQGVDGIIFGPITAEIGPAILKACEQAKIYCAAAARKPGVEPSDSNPSYVGYVVGDDHGDGQRSAQALKEAGVKACVGWSGLQGNSVADDRLKGFQQYMEANGVKVLDIIRPAELAEDGQKAVENFLAQFPGPRFDCAWSFDGDAAIGAISALEKARVLHKVKVGSLDASLPNVQAIQTSKLVASSAGGEFINGGFATIMVYDAINGRQPTKRGVVLEGAVVNKDNAAAFKRQFLDQLPDYDAKKLSRTYNPQATSDDFEVVLH
jgi:ribose transport system substrate-binding protein